MPLLFRLSSLNWKITIWLLNKFFLLISEPLKLSLTFIDIINFNLGLVIIAFLWETWHLVDLWNQKWKYHSNNRIWTSCSTYRLTKDHFTSYNGRLIASLPEIFFPPEFFKLAKCPKIKFLLSKSTTENIISRVWSFFSASKKLLFNRLSIVIELAWPNSNWLSAVKQR